MLSKTPMLIMFFALAAFAPSLAGTTGVMNGYVRDQNGRPAADAWVTVNSPNGPEIAQTDKHGFFVFMTLPPGTYIVQARKPGAATAYAIGARINSDQTTFLSFQFSPLRGCAADTPVTLASGRQTKQFKSLDVPLLEAYPPTAAPPVYLPLDLTFPPSMCL